VYDRWKKTAKPDAFRWFSNFYGGCNISDLLVYLRDGFEVTA